MFKIYQYGYQSHIFDRDFLESQVQDGSLSEADFETIVGGSDEKTETQSEA